MTVQYLVRRTFRVEPSKTLQSHAAARGVEIIASEWPRHLGATVIGTVGNAEKVAERVRDIAGGKSTPFLTRPTLPHYTATRDELVGDRVRSVRCHWVERREERSATGVRA